MMKNKTVANNFHHSAQLAIDNRSLQQALGLFKSNFIDKRKQAIAQLDRFDEWRDAAVELKDHTLNHLGLYLEMYEEKVHQSGGRVHWAKDAKQACEIVVDICRFYKAKNITKGKSMLSEEIHLNRFLQKKGFIVTETDLGEYIIQLRGEPPSHIVAPAMHLKRQQIERAFRKHHHHNAQDAPEYRQAEDLLSEARKVLRKRFLEADIGITGANFLIAQTGSSVIVTNEGNGDLTQSLPRTHIVVAGIEKIIPTIADLSCLLRILARSATGQESSTYTTISTGGRQDEDIDGAENYHVVLLDNNRSQLLSSSYQEVLRCIRCGACANHCPVYHTIGGHAYDFPYSGPIGAALGHLLSDTKKTYHLAHASTFCGRCEEVCPVRIGLPKLMRFARERGFRENLTPSFEKIGLKIWSYFAVRPRLYHIASFFTIKLLRLLSRGRGYINWLPFYNGFFNDKVMIMPVEDSFMKQFQRKQRHYERE